MTEEAAPAIPGLELPRVPESELAKAVEATLVQLQADGHLDTQRDAARMALARELAAVIAHKRTSGRASTVGQDAKVLLDLLDGMVPAEAASSVDLKIAQAMAEWSAAIAARGQASE